MKGLIGMDIRIYQINGERDSNHVGFMGYDRLEKYQGSSNIDSKIYDLIYENAIEARNLEDIFRIFNIDHPKDFRGHSLSVSDIVEVVDSNSVKSGFYFCDSIGFKAVAFDTRKCGRSERFNKENTYISIDEKIHNSANKISDNHSGSKKDLKTPDFER